MPPLQVQRSAAVIVSCSPGMTWAFARAAMTHPVVLVKDRWPCVGSLGVTAIVGLTAMTLVEV